MNNTHGREIYLPIMRTRYTICAKNAQCGTIRPTDHNGHRTSIMFKLETTFCRTQFPL